MKLRTKIAHHRKDRSVTFQFTFGLAEAGQIDNDNAAAGRERLDILAIIAETGGARTAAMDQDRRLALTNVIITCAGAGDVDEIWL